MDKDNPGADKAKVVAEEQRLSAEEQRLSKIAVEQDKIAAELEEKQRAIEEDTRALRALRKKFNKEIDVFEIAKGSQITLQEIGNGKGIERVTEKDFVKSAELERFMNEKVKIYVHPDGTQGALSVIVVTVNGVNQPIIRGRDQVVKRKYVEVLARSTITTYQQLTPDPTKPENIQMDNIVASTYPFTVREDKNPKGWPWLESIMKQPN